MPAQPKCKAPAWTDADHIAYTWCLDHGITIGMFATTPGFGNKHWEIEITIDNKKIKSPREYGPDELYPKVFELYKYYYNKYAQKI